MKLIFGLLSFIGGLAIWTLVTAKKNSFSLDEAWEQNKLILKGMSKKYSSFLEEIELTDNISSIDGFILQTQKLINNFSIIPVESIQGFWRIGSGRWWTFEIRTVCKAENKELLGRQLEQIIIETLQNHGWKEVVTRVRYNRKSDVPGQVYIAVDYACTSRNKKFLNASILRNEMKKADLRDLNLEKELEEQESC